jgi:phosphoglycolate phosphatase
MRYKLLIFDFDGTLADTFTWFVANINRAAQKYGFEPITPNNLESLRNTDALTLLRDHGIPGWKVPLIAGYMRKLMAQNIEKIRLFPGMDPVLHQLAKSGIKLALVSSNARGNIVTVLGQSAMLFSSYECGVGLAGKESKIKKVLRAAGTALSEAILIGDEIRDGRAARKAGVAFGAVTWGYNSAESLRALNPELLFEDVGAIATLAAS